MDTISNKDLSESKENDLIEWEYSLLSLKQDNNKNNDNKNKEDNLSLPDLIIDEWKIYIINLKSFLYYILY